MKCTLCYLRKQRVHFLKFVQSGSLVNGCSENVSVRSCSDGSICGVIKWDQHEVLSLIKRPLPFI